MARGLTVRGWVASSPVVRVVSTAWVLLLGCRAHLGVAPAEVGYRGVEVTAAVAEPEVGDELRASLGAALAARSALDEAGGVLGAEVLDADLAPASRFGETVLYRATVRVRFRAGGRTHDVLVERDVADPGSAEGAVILRAALLRSLLDEAAALGVAWAAGLPPDPAAR